MTGCCSPSRGPAQRPAVEPGVLGPSRERALDLVTLEGGATLVGSDDPGHPEEWRAQ